MSLDIEEQNHADESNYDVLSCQILNSPQRNLSPLHETARKLSRSRSRSYEQRSRSSSVKRSRSPRKSGRDNNSGRKRQRRDNDRRSGTRNRDNRVRDSQRIKELDRELGLKYRWEKTVYVSNIPYTTRWTDLKDLFRDKVGDIMFCEVFEKDGKSLGVGSVEFSNEKDADRAVNIMNQYEMGSRRISVRLDAEGFKTRQAKAQTKEREKNSRSSQSSSGMAQPNVLNLLGMGSSLTGSTGNGSGNGILGNFSQQNNEAKLLEQLAAQLKVEGPVTKRVFVASLDYKVNERKLCEVFKLAGKMKVQQFFKDRDGKSRGMAIIEYDTPYEALNAVAMFNDQVLLDRQMTVRFDHKPPGGDAEHDSHQAKLPSGLKSIGKPLMQIPQAAPSNIVDALSMLKGLQQQQQQQSVPNLGINLNGTAPSLLSTNTNSPQSLMSFNRNNMISNSDLSLARQHRHSTTNKIFVKNIPFLWDERKLKEKFRQAGTIEYAEIKMKDGRSRGCALICFSTSDQAVKGVELFNGSRFDGRFLEVNLDKMDD